ncbi:MAG: Hsp70 family protein [Desulfamplus sp.]|nr:Hsp70 family protein [Desulfamplus sp.]
MVKDMKKEVKTPRDEGEDKTGEVDQGLVIGIDLGTSNSLVSYIKNGSPRIIPNERGERMTPSVVHFRENGDVMVGQMAKNQAVINSERTVSLVKLAMGSDRVYTISDRQYTPVEISSYILAHLKKSAGAYLGHPVSRAVITVPAYFNDRQREDTLKAAEMAGLSVLKLLNEPTAAALVYGFSRQKETSLLVIDLGGGTLDITLMAYEGKVFQVKGVGGSTSIGGSMLDTIIVDKIIQDFMEMHGIDLKGDKIALQQLMINAEKAKIDLSSTEETQILIPYITVTPKGPIHLNMTLGRQDFEQLTSGVFHEICRHIDQTFEKSRLKPDWVDSVILVGGSTRVPRLESCVREILSSSGEHERDIKRNIHPDEAVARGAGILAGILEGSISDIEFHDITPHDLGIEDDDGEFIPIIPRGESYPTRAAHIVTNTEDNQESVVINVLQRMGMDQKSLLSLGWFELSIDPKKVKHQASIEITFAIDGNGLLEVTAMDLDTGDARAIQIHTQGI